MSEVDVTAYRSLADEIGELEGQLDAIQKEKMAVYARIREDYDKRTAKAMKNVMRVLRMDDSKRAESLLVDAEAESILKALKKAPCAARVGQNVVKPGEEPTLVAPIQESANALAASSLPVADEVPHDPETGEILAEAPSGPETLVAGKDDRAVSPRYSFDQKLAAIKNDDDDPLEELPLDKAA